MNELSFKRLAWRNVASTLIFAFLLVSALAALLADYSLGGDSWKQGDWLIHGLSGPVRRGIFGSLVVISSDILGLSPLLLVLIVQGSIVTVIYLVLWMACQKLASPEKLLLLMLSPGFLLVFWHNDPQGAFRKEILAYLAFMPLLLGAMRGRAVKTLYVASAVVYAVSVAAHEANVFFLPFLCLAMWLILPDNATLRLRISILAIPTILAVCGALYAVLNTHAPDTDAICLELMQRGLGPDICRGSIDYLRTTPQEARIPPARLLTTEFREFLLLYLVCLLGFRVLAQGSPNVGFWTLGGILSGVVFLPLYILAGDYGRWLNFHITALCLVTLIALVKYRPAWLYTPSMRTDFLLVLILSLAIGVSHSPGDLIDGLLLKSARQILGMVS